MITPKTAIQKGKLLENYVADEIESKGLGKARRSHGSGSGNREKADIDTDMMLFGRNIGIECKNYANAHVKSWWKQVKKLEVLNREPILVYKLDREPLPEAKVIMYLESFLMICQQAKAPKSIDLPNRELKWALQQALQANKRLLKLLGE